MWFLRNTSYKLDEIPAPFGWFHLVFLFLTILVLSILLIKIKKLDMKKMDKVMFGCGLFLLVTEIYKQLLCSLVVYPDGYPWHLFPFQLCSVPMYLFLMVPFIKKEKIKKAIYSFLGYFMTMSGVMFYLIPSLSHVLSICIHSMLWHMVLIVIGILLIIKGDYGKTYKEIIPGFIVFLILVGIATTMNVVFYHTIVKYTSKTFSMFYISPYFTSSLAVFSDIHKALGWIPLMISYVAACFLAVSLIYVVIKYIKKWCLSRTLKSV